MQLSNNNTHSDIQPAADFFNQTTEQPPMIILPEHFHTTDRIDFRDIFKKKLYVHHNLVGTAPATAGNFGAFWIAPFDCTITEIRVVWGTASSGTATIDFEKLTGTTAAGSGSVMLAATVDATATANTITTPVLTATLANLQIARGDRIAIKNGGTLTALANVSAIIEITF